MLVKNYKPGQHNLLLFFSSCKEPPHITCKCKDIFYNACVMDVHLEGFSLRNIGKQFREFNSAIKKNHARLSPYFWWVCKSDFVRFNFILSGLVMEKISHVMHDLPYNKKFIIRCDEKFAGVIGLDGVGQNAPRAEVWYFVTNENEGRHIVSSAINSVEDFARAKHIDKIYARTTRDNRRSQYLLDKKGFHHYYPTDRKNRDTLQWCKYLNDKNY